MYVYVCVYIYIYICNTIYYKILDCFQTARAEIAGLLRVLRLFT